MSDLQPWNGVNSVERGIAQAKQQKADTDYGGTLDTNQKITPGKVRNLWNLGARVVRPEQRQFWLNKAAVRGEQWVYWDRQRDKLTQLPADDRVRVTVNKMGPISRRLAAKANKRELQFEVVPRGADDESLLESQIAEAILEHVHREHNWERLREQEWWARWEGGTAVLALDWDADAGVALGHDDASDKDFGTGDIRCTVLSIAECCTEPGERDIEHARWWIKVQTMPPHKAQALYGLKELPPADATMALSPFQTQVMSTDNRQVQVPMTLVLSYYERPSRACPDGQVGTYIADQEIEWSTWPFPFRDRLNLVCFRETKVQDRWNGDTILSSSQPVQTGYNASWSSILEHLKQASNARLAVPDTSIDNIDELTDNPGELFFYNPAGPAPAYMAPPQMPQWWVQMPQLLDACMQDILSSHPEANGEAPPNLESGLGMSILGEMDDGPMEAMIKETAEGWQRYGKMVLELYAAMAKETRTVRIEGPGKAPQVMDWKGADIKGCSDVRCPIDAIMPISQAAAHARAQALWDRKIITDPKMYARIAQLPDAKLIQAIDPDVSKAMRENLDMAKGGAPIPAVFDDHAKHIAAHNDYRKSERYENLPTNKHVPADMPDGTHQQLTYQQVFDMHVQAHETLAAEAAGTQLSQQMVHPALGQSPNASGQQPVPDGQPGLLPTPTSIQAPPPPVPGPGIGAGPGGGGTGPATPPPIGPPPGTPPAPSPLPGGPPNGP